jgi:hypothetical protein
MSQNTAIQWADATWNPVSGCTQISPGCDHCYALTFAERFRGVPRRGRRPVGWAACLLVKLVEAGGDLGSARMVAGTCPRNRREVG